MRVAVMGTGYVGLVSAACFADLGAAVKCYDVDSTKVDLIQRGEAPFHEPGLRPLLQSVLKSGRLSATRDLASAVTGADLVFITVGTPPILQGTAADVSAVFAAARSILPFLRRDAVVVIKSTVPVGTCRKVAAAMREENPAVCFHIASNPEFLREGQAVSDFFSPDRVVVGCETPQAREKLHALYAPLKDRDIMVFDTTLESAELIKHASNAFLAMKITYINEIADFCEQVKADIDDVATGIGLDKRIGKRFLRPGPGFGGSCFPKDTRDFAQMAKHCGVRQELVEQVILINEARKLDMAHRVLALMKSPHAGKSVAVLGVTFKPDTDDMREAPSLTIIPALQAAGLRVKAHDPQAGERAKVLLRNVEWCDSPYDAAQDADLAVLLTEWEEYKSLDFHRFAGVLRNRVIFDMRNFISRQSIEGTGLTIHGLGRSEPWQSTRRAATLKTVSGHGSSAASRTAQAIGEIASMSKPKTKSSDDGRTILVGGGAGFIGAHLCERLLLEGHEVICVDSLQTGFRANVDHLRDSGRFVFEQTDVTQPVRIEKKLKEVYNLACPASPVAYQADPVHTLKTSVFGTLNLLELAHAKHARILHASTSEIYGDPLHHPQRESDWGNVNPIGPRACYDEGKRCAETLCFDYHRMHKVTIRVARIFNTYGPRMSPSDGRVVSNFIVQALQNRNVTVYGDGTQTRSFCYIDDLVEGLLRLMAAPPPVMGPINLGNPQESTVAELARLIIDLTGSRSRIVHKPLPVDDPKQRRPDISKARKDLGWIPRVPLKEGLERTIAYFEAVIRQGRIEQKPAARLFTAT
jgi:UDPglucose 6-dehydrogenase